MEGSLQGYVNMRVDERFKTFDLKNKVFESSSTTTVVERELHEKLVVPTAMCRADTWNMTVQEQS